MKDWMKKISVSVVLAVCELLLGLSMLIDPTGLASIVIIVTGVLLILLGGLHLYQYMRLPKEEAAQTWKLATGAGILAVGISFVTNQHWMVQMLGTLTTLYGILILTSAFMKLQIGVDALRGKHPFWYLMVISFVFSAVLATLLFFNPFRDSVWIVSGIVLIALAVLDAAYFILGRKNKEQ